MTNKNNIRKFNSRIIEFLLVTIPLALYAPFSLLLCYFYYLIKPPKKFKYKASICLIFKDEGPYLKEWLEYHLLIGITHFYLYNNNSRDNYKEILKPYIEKGIVTLTEWPEKYAQIKAYNHCYRNAKEETEWLGFTDIDEFINIKNCNDIKVFLESYVKYPSIYLNWRMFGTNGYLEENYDELTIERYTQSWKSISKTGKTFINNQYANHIISSVHYSSTKFGRMPIFGVLVNRRVCFHFHSLGLRGIENTAYINHYWSRSKAFYYYKAFYKGDAVSEDNEIRRFDLKMFIDNELRNIVKDFSILRWLVFLKEKMKN